jgi:hypothetical protein
MRAALIAAIATIPAAAHITITTKLTWAKEISRIVYARCLSCHNAGAPVDLSRYELARPWAKAIQEEVLRRRMPPWGAVKGFGEFSPDHGLSQEEITLIAEWVEGGAPEGDPNLLPEKPRQFDAPPAPRGVPRTAPLKLSAAHTLTALRAAAATRVTAELPDGTVEPLLWVIAPPKKSQVYVLRQPVRLPPGTRIKATSPTTVYLR